MSGETSTAIVTSAADTPAPVPVLPRCSNCATELHGEYCSHCGQRVEPHIHSLWGFMSEAAESITHADSRVWRTLVPLVIRPGFLTREFLDGRRARYLPPFRLYLVLSVIFFLVVSFEGKEAMVVDPATNPAVATERERVLAEIRPDVAKEVAAAQADAAKEAAAAKVAQATRGAAERMQTGSCENLTYEGPAAKWVQPRLKPLCEKIREDEGHSLAESFKHNLPRAMFVFLPLLAGVMKLLYWRPKRWYVEHLLLFVHNHAFAFLAFSLVALSSLLFGDTIESVLIFGLFFYVPWYVYRSMRTMYGQPAFMTLAKMSVLSIAYFVSLTIMVIVTALYSVVTL